MSKPKTSENPFSKLQEEQEEQFEKIAGAVKSNIEGRKGFWELVGDIIDLYVPKVVGTIFGGSKAEPKKLDTNESFTENQN